jgi:hypothetical protein
MPWRTAATSRMLSVLGLVLLIAMIGYYLVRQLLRGERMAARLIVEEANFRTLAEGSSDMVIHTCGNIARLPTEGIPAHWSLCRIE